MTDNKDCSGCRYYLSNGRCFSAPFDHWTAVDCREVETDCGPSARYYEPKEQP